MFEDGYKKFNLQTVEDSNTRESLGLGLEFESLAGEIWLTQQYRRIGWLLLASNSKYGLEFPKMYESFDSI